jgi:hypothetical protein
MQSSAPDWMRLVYKLKDDPSGIPAKIVARLPQFLGRGASALEVARNIQMKPEDVSAVLEDLAQYELVKIQPSGLNVSFGEKLYSMTAEGMQFFKQMAMQGSNKSF